MKALLAALAVCIAMPAAAQQRCALRPVLVAHLAAKYSETVHGMGMAGGNMVLELFVSDDTGTFTITITRPDGVTCLIASGEGYEAVTSPAPISGDPL